jgi:ubiquinone/menaquinone biosynthesis C-methylase UbiE
MKSWSEFWENDTTYACEKHKEIVENCTTNQQIELVNKNDTVLDFGCGESSKNRLSNAVKELYLYGDANQIIQRLQKRYKNKKNIYVLDNIDKAGSYSIIFVCSVIQYLSKEDLIKKIKYFKSVLRPGGRLVISDIIPKKTSPLKEIFTLIKLSISKKFFIKAILNIFRMIRSDYGYLRKDLGLSKYDKDEILEILKTNGFEPHLHKNIGLNKERFCIISFTK